MDEECKLHGRMETLLNINILHSESDRVTVSAANMLSVISYIILNGYWMETIAYCAPCLDVIYYSEYEPMDK